MKKPASPSLRSRVRSNAKPIALVALVVVVACVVFAGVAFVAYGNMHPGATSRQSAAPGQTAAQTVTTDLTVAGDLSVHIVQATGTCGFPWSAGAGAAVTGGEAADPSSIPSGATVGIAYRLSGIADGQPWRLDAVSIDGGKRYPPSIGFSLNSQPFSLQTLPDSKSLVLSLDGSGATFKGLQLRSLDGAKKITLDGTLTCK